ncbi:SIS domain-containing protein [Sphingomonas sp. CL5.1]|uniref:SIS domain-containing protein n=1 Tax=Sphingomonas sp. CL5.1 TaxID=2653203 RepID=UPI001581B959|nr:SIS domain-containing protein [Sphingomonas sp. CL5.1]QKS01119.1 SIS domain-containing protein [Sphingomonas sp. CL5.1]
MLAEALADAWPVRHRARCGLSIAAEAALKLKETCALHAEAFNAAEVRHGPMALFDLDFPLLVFRQEDEAADSIEVPVELSLVQGYRVFVTGGLVTGAVRLETVDVVPVVQLLLEIRSFCGAVNAVALRRGMDPDIRPCCASHGDRVVAWNHHSAEIPTIAPRSARGRNLYRLRSAENHFSRPLTLKLFVRDRVDVRDFDRVDLGAVITGPSIRSGG